MQRIEQTILSNLLYSEEYLRKCYPFLKSEYFTDQTDNRLFKVISKFIDGYNTTPTKEALEITLQNERDIREDQYESCVELLNDLEPSDTEFDWLIDESEAFCKRQAVFNAVTRAITIIDGKDKEFLPEAIPSILQEALAVAFNTDVGHDYFENSGDRFDYYNETEERLPFSLSMFNKITQGGPTKKSLTIFLAPTGGGKTVMLCNEAAFHVSIGKNVLYFTAEMADVRISERVDANILDVPVSELKHMKKNVFVDRLDVINKKTHGKLIVKEFPTASAHVGHLKSVLNDLKTKKNFVPDVIYVDYLAIFLSQRYKSGTNANSYTILKAVAEELRGLASEYNVPVITAQQVNRAGMSSSDIDMTDVSDSSGILFTADLILAITPTEELDEMGQTMIKQLKNRWGDISKFTRFVIGKDFSRMKFFDVDNPVAGMMQVAKEKEVAESKDQFNGFKPVKAAKIDGKNFDGIRY